MAIRIIVKDPDPVLREIAKPVPKMTSNIKKLLNDLADTMYDAEGVGLAAPQIGISKRAIVVDAGEDYGGLIGLVNPQIVSKEGEQIGPEGCLSIPGLSGEVKRAQKLVVQGWDGDGNDITMEAEDFLARVLQHEIDHLNGILFIDVAETIYERESIVDGDEIEETGE